MATDTNTQAQSGPPYATYSDVPAHRQQWFFWLTYFTVTPVALGLLLSGDVFYERKGEVRAFGTANKVVAGIAAVGLVLQFLFVVLKNS